MSFDGSPPAVHVPVLRAGEGYVDLVEAWGSDARIAAAAGASTALPPRDVERRLRRMWNADPRHTTPFEFAGVTLYVRAPIFVTRQWLRHRWSVAIERSMRRTAPGQHDVYDFSDRPDFSLAVSTAAALSATTNRLVAEDMRASGAPLEVANRVYGTITMSEFVWSANLTSVANFLRLRRDHHAQWEMQQYADAVLRIVESQFPITGALLRGEVTT